MSGFEDELGEREAFLTLLRSLSSGGSALFEFFEAKRPVGVARAPGRLDVMGGIADYSGSLVLEMPIREAAFCAAQLHSEPEVRVVSVSPVAPHSFREVRLPAAPLLTGSYAQARELFRGLGDADWAAYVAGPLVALARECGLSGVEGARIFLASGVPEGKGVSSSAAVEVAAFFALAEAGGIEVEPRDAALFCQRTENLIVGAPCGVMDPMTSALGRRGQMLELLCQPAVVQGHLCVPSGIRLYGIDSGLRHAVRGADYGQVRVAAFMGYRILAEALGLRIERVGEGRVRIEDPRYGGYLANLSPAELDDGLIECLPSHITGKEFLRRYEGTTDATTQVEPERIYPVRTATEHPVREHQRVRQFGSLLRSGTSERHFSELGALMLESHASYTACGLGSDGTDDLVRRVRELGAGAGLFGAKITGGGSGGTVAVLASADAESTLRALVERYSAESGLASRLFVGSSAGAAEFGTVAISGDGLVK